MKHYSITRDKFLSEDEKKQLLVACKKKAIIDASEGRKTWVTRYILAHTALNSGLRVSEIAALKMGDLFFNGLENYVLVRHGKGDKKRDVYLDQGIVLHIKNYIAVKKQRGESITKTAPLLTGRGGNHYTTTALHISFNRAIEEADLPENHTIHSSRHTYATLLLSKTNNLRFVQKQLGHASINTTALYAHVLPEINQALADKME